MFSIQNETFGLIDRQVISEQFVSNLYVFFVYMLIAESNRTFFEYF